MERLFVYGTLAPSKANHSVLADIPGSWEAASLKGKLLDEGWGSEFGCPGIVPTDEGEEVRGFLFSSDHLTEQWPKLDEYEGTGYKRVLVMVKSESGEKMEAYVYALNHAG
jgi:gamma-glutamylcyclotransferase (GGCT)/AIG2-like uncharacterized protein YtfP